MFEASAIQGFISAIGIGFEAYGMAKKQGTYKDEQAGIKAEAAAAQREYEASARAEALRFQQMEMEGARRQRDIIRNAQVARATALNRAASQGAQFGSGLQGGYGQIAGEESRQLSAVQGNLGIGRGLFQENVNISEARSAGATARGQQALARSEREMYQGYTQFGQQLLGGSEAAGKVGSQIFSGIGSALESGLFLL